MSHLALFATENNKETPILIIDKKGVIGERLVSKLQTESTIVFVSNKLLAKHENIIHIPFKKNYPALPDNHFSQIIILNDDNSLEKGFLEKFLKKSVNANIFLGINNKFLSEKLFEQTVLRYENLKLGIFGDIFAKEFIYSAENEINKAIIGVKQSGRINIPNEGAEELRPVLLDDAVEAVLHICFSPQKEKIYYIMPKTPISMFSLATLFKKTFPDIKIDFYKTRAKQKFKTKKIVLKGNHILGENYNLSEKIKKISFNRLKYSPSLLNKEKRSKSPIFYTSLFFLTLILLPLLLTYFCLFTGKSLLNTSVNNLNNGDNSKAKTYANISRQIMFLSIASLFILKQEAHVFGKENIINPTSEQATNYYALSNFYFKLSLFLNTSNNLINGYSSSPLKDFDKAMEVLSFSNIDFNLLKNKQSDGALFKKLENIYGFTSSTSSFWPEIFGFNGKRKYIVLVVDSMKVGTSSGVISHSYIEIEKGKTTNIKSKQGSLPKEFLLETTNDLIKQNNLNGVIILDKSNMDQISKYLVKNNFVTIKSLDYLITLLKQKKVKIVFANPIEEAIIFVNGYSEN